SSSQVDVSWNAATDNVGVIGYDIFRNGAFLVSVGAVTSYSDTTVAPTTSYGYTVLAKDEAGNASAQSSPPASATTPEAPDLQAPSTPGNLSAVAASSRQVNLTWSPSTDNVGVAGYEIFRDNVSIAVVGLVTSFSDTTVQPRTNYRYQVRARDVNGNLSPLTNPSVKIKTPA
ncbi:MAG TPA: fibronectin type III domain-containing protein, partial [Nitrososphaera sp.]|nr:fibronectin type III domain-containing protein [Nitrososphaera sp.]